MPKIVTDLEIIIEISTINKPQLKMPKIVIDLEIINEISTINLPTQMLAM